MKKKYMEKLAALYTAVKAAFPVPRDKLRNVLPMCALTLALTLTAAMADMTDTLISASPRSDGAAVESAPRTEDYSSLSVLLTAEGYRVERSRMLLSGAEDESFFYEERQEQLSADGYRTERLASVLGEEAVAEAESPAALFDTEAEETAAAEKQIAMVDDTLYAYAEEEERWVVIDSPLAGNASSFNAAENAEKVYAFAKEVLGVNTAAACGILSNLYHESGFNPRAVFIEADGRVSYGLCQWNAGRLTALREYCVQHGYDPTTLAGQLQYLQYELKYRERAAFYRVKSAPDTANGAYQAGYDWAKYFERCAARYYPPRAEMAYSTYWMKYGNASDRFILSIIGETYPAGTIARGSAVELCGVIRSDVKITRVSAFVTDSGGNAVLSWRQDWNSPRYDIQTDGLNGGMAFGTLPNGSYTYTVYATDASGASRALVQSAFAVTGSAVLVEMPGPYVTVPAVEEADTEIPAEPGVQVTGEIPAEQPPVDALKPPEGSEAAAPEAPLPEPAVSTQTPEGAEDAPLPEETPRNPQTGGTVSAPPAEEPSGGGTEVPESEWFPPEDPNGWAVPSTGGTAPAPSVTTEEPGGPEEPEEPETQNLPETPAEEPDTPDEWAPPEPSQPVRTPEAAEEPETPPEEPETEETVPPETEEPVELPEDEWLPPAAN